ncbi:hypothetical protein EVAR_36872_1 [Eumeta japonica]|uniref:Uncharacterized protein n=1 Tax=Eumeta variegata TaxID=151549 RepID=A0A4C1WUT8_EUMVA|nr:hypothetical protein EVAR_36872_1 [Eumeta japonica]
MAGARKSDFVSASFQLFLPSLVPCVYSSTFADPSGRTKFTDAIFSRNPIPNTPNVNHPDAQTREIYTAAPARIMKKCADERSAREFKSLSPTHKIFRLPLSAR